MNNGLRRMMQIVAVSVLSYLMGKAYGFHGVSITVLCLAVIAYAIMSGDDL